MTPIGEAEAGTLPQVKPAPEPPKRVRKLAAQVAESRGVVALQTDRALTEADTPKVLKERRQAAEAFKLRVLAEEPARRALRDYRVRRLVAVVGGVGLVGALGWSTANVHDTVVAGQQLSTQDAAWWMAFMVEPVVSIGLLLIFGVRAYIAATRGVSIVDSTLRRVEVALLSITLTVNSWRYLPWVTHRFSFIELLVHSIGPIVAVLLVTVIPVLWQYLTELGDTGTADPDLGRWLTVARTLIAEGVLSVDPGVNATERALRERGGRISTAMARRVHRCLTGNVKL